MKITLYDPPEVWLDLLPFTYTRPISEIRVGGLKIREKWESYLKPHIGYFSERYLSGLYAANEDSSLILWSNILPNLELVKAISELKEGQLLVDNEGSHLALVKSPSEELEVALSKNYESIRFPGEVRRINHLWDIFQENGTEIGKDYHLVTEGRSSAPIIDQHTRTYNEGQIFLEEGVKIRSAILNAEDGPIYLGKNSLIQEGAIIQGPFYLGDHSIVNLGTKVRKNNSTGPHTKIGGELSNSVIMGYSNKAHDGFLGNSVIGEWCNIGADTNTSNLKNNYSEVKIWNYRTERFINTGSQFCGLMMGDHSKCAINTMFNTGTVVGVAANIFGAGFPRTSVPSFSWGGTSGYKTFEFEKALEAADAMMKRRDKELGQKDKEVLSRVFELSKKYRIWENS